MSSVYLRAVGVLLVVLALGACGGGDDSEGVEQVGEANGLTQYEVASAGFAVGVPEGWETASADEALDDEALEQMRQDSPELAPLIDALAGSDSLIKFVAFDPENAEEFTTNMNIVVEETPSGITPVEYFEASRRTVEQIVGTPDIEEDRVDMPAGEAMQLSYVHTRNPAGIELQAVQYVFYEGTTGYTLTYTTLPDQLSTREAEFERSARSFRIL